jgi:hypothetical protein
MNLSEILGTIGVGLILLAYLCNTFNYIQNEGKLFFALNTIGAALACASSALIPFWPFIILEAVWTVVSIIGWAKAKK